MASVFLCHASEDKNLVEPMQLALVGAGHKVFYDDQSLPPGGDYHQKIQKAIAKSDLFIFVATEASIAPGKFTLSELKFARDRWPSPVNRVLPVLIPGTEVSGLPVYLQAATVLKIDGNAATEVLAASTRILAIHHKRKLVAVGLGIVSSVVATVLIAFFGALQERLPTSVTDKSERAQSVRMEGRLTFRSEPGDYIGGGNEHRLSNENGIITATVREGSIAISFEGDDHWSAEFAAPRGEELTVGSYADAQRTPFNNPLKPGMSVSGASRGCNELNGSFMIERLETDANGILRSLKLAFEQRCDSGSGQLLGTIDVHATGSK